MHRQWPLQEQVDQLDKKMLATVYNPEVKLRSEESAIIGVELAAGTELLVGPDCSISSLGPVGCLCVDVTVNDVSSTHLALVLYTRFRAPEALLTWIPILYRHCFSYHNNPNFKFNTYSHDFPPIVTFIIPEHTLSDQKK